jgi:large exoprotein involved in heme utilization and adhesion
MGGANTKSDTVLLTNSAVTTEAVVADGGNITILADSMVRLRDGKITTAVRSGEGGGGNIKIDPEFVILESFSQIIANAFGGPGGNIDIIADAFLADVEKSIVSASSVLGVDGQINIDAITDLSGAITPLEKRFSEAATLLRQRCAERLRGGQISSFIVGGRDGVPLEPGELLPSPLYMVEEPVVPGRGDRQEHTPDESAGFIGFDEQGQPHIRAWPLPGFSQAWLNLECAGWLME